MGYEGIRKERESEREEEEKRVPVELACALS